MSKPGNAYVKVFYRIFPTEKPCWDYLKVKDKTKVYLRNLQQLFDPSKAKQPPIFWEFDTDGVFFNSRQEFVYSEVMGDILEKVCKGSNGIVAAFGETGSGKSLTMAGLDLSEENLGIAPRAINGLFALKKTLPRNLRMCIQMSYAEFSKTSAVDLLKEFPNDLDAWHTKETVTKIKVKCAFDALKLLYLGEGRKSSVETENYMSHNNTSVVTFHITTMDVDFSQPRQISSREQNRRKRTKEAFGITNDLKQLIDQPTRIPDTNSQFANTLLDLFLTTHPDLYQIKIHPR